MELDPEEPVDLCRVRSPFEADTIAACLQDRGFRACALTLAARTVQWEGGISNSPRVQIPRCELADALAVLAAVKEQAKSINWEEEIQKSQTGARGSVCAHCGASREGLEMDLACTNCGMPASPPQPDLSSEEVERRHLRSKHLLYFGLFLIILPFLFSALLSAINRIF